VNIFNICVFTCPPLRGVFYCKRINLGNSTQTTLMLLTPTDLFQIFFCADLVTSVSSAFPATRGVRLQEDEARVIAHDEHRCYRDSQTFYKSLSVEISYICVFSVLLRNTPGKSYGEDRTYLEAQETGGSNRT